MCASKLELRKYPFPYRCAYTICSDIDGCTFDTFLALHRFLNSTEQTGSGEGLGLDIGDTFWLYSAHPSDMAFFEGLSDKRLPAAEVIEDFIRAGYIDCLHSYGDFVPNGLSSQSWRRLVGRGLGRLKKEGLLADTWVNHGPADAMNLLARNHPSYLGDNPQSEVYHFDLLKVYGIRFAWLNELTDIIIHEVDFWHAPLTIGKMKTINVSKNIVKHLIGARRKVRSTRALNSLIEPKQLRDKNKVLSFKRFHIGEKGIWKGANREGLARQLTEPVLKELINREGTVIVYTHMGKTERDSGNVLFDPNTLKGLRRLASEYQAGRIFVTTTSRLLNFVLRRNGMKWLEVTSEDGITDVHLQSIEDPVLGSRSVRLADLEGICFRASEPNHLRIWLGDKVVDADFAQECDVDSFCTGFYFSRLRFPEKYI